MNSEPGKTLLHYRLTEKIGEGGMGVVWKATDTSLDREVAIKILPPEFSADGDRLARFEREAKLLASLNHTNIATVHGLHESEGTRFLAMELAPGEDLSQRLQRGALPLELTLEVAHQVACALEAAHEQGVIHRDLKPANVQLAPDGSVKVLDFGLAKALAGDMASGSSSTSVSMSPTMTSARTIAGVILGTASYMAPEQAHGRAVDRRADVWAFGCLLYEMLTGKRAFVGESISDTLASVLKLDADMSAVTSAPRALQALLRRCLEKDPRRRLQAIGEARILLEDLIAGKDPGAAAGDGMTAAAAPRGVGSRVLGILPWMIVLLLVIALVGSEGGRNGSGDPAGSGTTPTRVSMRLGSDTSLREHGGIALSRDGRSVAFVQAGPSGDTLWVRNLDELEARELPDTRGAHSPFFSPDGRSIAFFSSTGLHTVPVEGGSITTVANPRSARGGTWCADGSIVFTASVRGGLWRIVPGQGKAEPFTTMDIAAGERSHRWPYCLDDGAAVLFSTQTAGQDYHDGTIEMADLETGTRTVLHRGGAYPRAVGDRWLTFARQGRLYAAPFDPEARTVGARPQAVFEDLMSSTGNQAAADGSAQYDVAANGRLLYRTGWNAGSRFPILWVDRQGNETIAFDQVGTYTDPRLSPDGKKLVVTRIDGTANDLWVLDIARGTFTRFTFGNGLHYFPIWSPDGDRIAYTRDMIFTGRADDAAAARDEGRTMPEGSRIYIKRANGTGTEDLVYTSEVQLPGDVQRIALANPCSWSPDGSVLGVHGLGTDGEWNINLLRLDERGDGSTGDEASEPARTEPFATGPFRETFCEFSPGGKLIAYVSNESGNDQVYVRPYPDTGGRWQVSVNGGHFPRWTKNGTELVYRASDAVMAVPVQRDAAGGVSFGRPEKLFEGNYLDLNPFSAWDAAADGSRFILLPSTQDRDDRSDEAVLVQGWLADLQ